MAELRPNNIQRLRAERGLTEEQLAAEIILPSTGEEMAQSWLNRISRGRIEPRITTAHAIAEALGVSIEEAFALGEHEVES